MLYALYIDDDAAEPEFQKEFFDRKDAEKYAEAHNYIVVRAHGADQTQYPEDWMHETTPAYVAHFNALNHLKP